MDLELSREDLTRVVDQAVEELLAAASVQAPPIDALVLAQRHLGLKVCLDRREPSGDKVAQTFVDGQIFLSPDASEEVRQWTVAHAVGEHLKPSLLLKLGIDPEQRRPMMGTSLTNLFAEHLLLPSLWFGGDASACDFDVLELKQRYRTASHETIAFRLLDLPDPCVITIVDNGEVHRRKSNGIRVKKKLEPPERECQRYVSKQGEPHRVCKDGWTVQGWPAGGVRVILRSVIEME